MGGKMNFHYILNLINDIVKLPDEKIIKTYQRLRETELIFQS